ncbi:MAG: metal-dependent transcriptional regulator [Thermoplasmata archaeon]|nr:metal-dependent transcriptional regulator [Thermoplasmata archaeon]
MKNYITAIYEAGGEKEFVRTSDVAKALGYRPSSVTETFQKMAQEGVIVYIPYRGVKLTEKGKRIVDKTIARQSTLRNLLLYIGAPQDLAKIESKKLEQVISDRGIECIRNFLKTREEEQ